MCPRGIKSDSEHTRWEFQARCIRKAFTECQVHTEGLFKDAQWQTWENRKAFRQLYHTRILKKKKKKKRFKSCLFSPILLHCPKMAYFICIQFSPDLSSDLKAVGLHKIPHLWDDPSSTPAQNLHLWKCL